MQSVDPIAFDNCLWCFSEVHLSKDEISLLSFDEFTLFGWTCSCGQVNIKRPHRSALHELVRRGVKLRIASRPGELDEVHASLPPITPDEILAFHNALESL